MDEGRLGAAVRKITASASFGLPVCLSVCLYDCWTGFPQVKDDRRGMVQ